MQEIKHKIEGPYHMEQDTILTGMVAGNLIIDGGVHLNLRGMVTENLIAKAGSHIDIYGMVGGISNTDERAQTQIAAGAVVKE